MVRRERWHVQAGCMDMRLEGDTRAEGEWGMSLVCDRQGQLAEAALLVPPCTSGPREGTSQHGAELLHLSGPLLQGCAIPSVSVVSLKY